MSNKALIKSKHYLFLNRENRCLFCMPSGFLLCSGFLSPWEYGSLNSHYLWDSILVHTCFNSYLPWHKFKREKINGPSINIEVCPYSWWIIKTKSNRSQCHTKIPKFSTWKSSSKKSRMNIYVVRILELKSMNIVG